MDDASPAPDGREKKIDKIIKEICATSFIHLGEGKARATELSDFDMLPIIQLNPMSGDKRKPSNPLADIQKRLNEQKLKDLEKINNSEMNTPKFLTPDEGEGQKGCFQKHRFNFSMDNTEEAR